MREGYAERSAVRASGRLGRQKRTHAPSRVSAWGREVWTLAEASVECSVMSGATTAGADDTSDAEERESAGGGDGTDGGEAVE